MQSALHAASHKGGEVSKRDLKNSVRPEQAKTGNFAQMQSSSRERTFATHEK